MKRAVRMNGVSWRVVSCAAVAILLAGCGQKGPLYMPDQGGEVVTRPSGQQSQSPETAPQPSTQSPPATTTKPDEEKKATTPR